MEPTQADYGRVFEPLDGIHSKYREFGAKGPVPESRAARDCRTALGRMAWHLALPAGVIGVDHLLAWRAVRMSAEIQPSFAHLTLIRASIEGAAVARWLCDPGIDATVRLRRAAGAQLDDYKQRRAFEREMDFKVAPGGQTATQRIEALERLLRARHIEPIVMPSATDLFAMYARSSDPKASGEKFFRMISGVIHSKVWSLFGISDLGDPVEVSRDQRSVPVRADEKLAFGATVLAMRVASEALADIEKYAAAQP
jgi:hypothetical protein